VKWIWFVFGTGSVWCEQPSREPVEDHVCRTRSLRDVDPDRRHCQRRCAQRNGLVGRRFAGFREARCGSSLLNVSDSVPSRDLSPDEKREAEFGRPGTSCAATTVVATVRLIFVTWTYTDARVRLGSGRLFRIRRVVRFSWRIPLWFDIAREQTLSAWKPRSTRLYCLVSLPVDADDVRLSLIRSSFLLLSLSYTLCTRIDRTPRQRRSANVDTCSLAAKWIVYFDFRVK